MTRATAQKLGLLGALYLSQGLPYGFFTQALPVMMRQSGRSLEQIGLASLLAIPWALKFVWAPQVDQHGSREFGLRKSWIVPLQIVTALVLATAGFLEPKTQFDGLFAIVLLVNALAATQDIATDGLAVDILDTQERGLANGLQVGGYRLGMVLGGGVILIFYSYLGWRTSFFCMAAAILLATVPIAFHREVPAPGAFEREAKSLHFLQLKGAWPLLALLFVFKFGESLASTMLRPFMTDHGLTLLDVGWMLGTVGFAAGLFGALLGGYLAGRLPRKQALIVCAIAQACTLASYVIVSLGLPGKLTLAAVVGAEHAGSGMATAALFTCMMDWCRPGHSGSDYTVQASTVVISTSTAAALSGWTAHQLGYTGNFALAFAMGLVALAAIFVRFPQGAPTER